MSLEEILSLDIYKKDCVIIGNAASGKTFLSNELLKMNKYHTIIHTDDYKEFGFEQGLYTLIDEMQYVPEPRIFEGVLCYRLLRKGLTEIDFYPPIVIVCETNKKRQQEVYLTQRDPKKLRYMKSFEAGLMTIYNEYRILHDTMKPNTKIYTFENNY